MNSNYRLKRMYVENFKHIAKWERELDCEGQDLIVLDGPNGFGKTTMFDVFELVLTGKLYRIKNDDKREAYSEDLLRKDSSKQCLIKLEFTDESEKSFTLIKMIPENSGKESYRPDDFSRFKTYVSNQFHNDKQLWRPVSQIQVDEMFDMKDFSRFYSLFYYIQQEENTFFLKKTSKERMNEIGQLFDTKKEENQKQSILEIKNILSKEVTRIKKDKELLMKSLGTLQKEVNTESNNSSQIPYAQLFPNLSPTKLWDEENPILRVRETKDEYIQELDELMRFVNQFDHFLETKHNVEIDAVCQNRSLLEGVITATFFLDKFEETKAKYYKEERLRKVLTKLSKEKFTQNPEDVNFESLLTDVGHQFDIDDLKTRISGIINTKKEANSLSSIVRQMNETRETLLKQYHLIQIKHEHALGVECPLCGYNWVELDYLLEEVKRKGDAFSEYYDNATTRLVEQINTIFSMYIEPIIFSIDEQLNLKGVVDPTFFSLLNNSMESKGKINSCNKWCETIGFNLEPYILKDTTAIADMEVLIDQLASAIQMYKHIDTSQNIPDRDTYNRFKSIYKEIFNENVQDVKKISPEMIVEKKTYIDILYYSKRSETIDDLNKKIDTQVQKYNKLTARIEEINKIVEVYNSSIKRHWNEIMKDIEIPFFIYSGKIIQYYQKGLGIFIKENSSGEAKSLKFVSDNVNDHDVVNYFSSGQLSALVIAFTLALNKVYGNKKLGMLLIDDPVQTMDEINMASLTELLRNEFRDKQIIISTHEEEVSRYIRYKFNKYGYNTMRFNVKQDLFALTKPNLSSI
ncbi:AAA family ATPase [Paenibacillus sp. UKAQ_18]|nr:AAA family ATPase [Paenibacillus sp. UKAQ_18]